MSATAPSPLARALEHANAGRCVFPLSPGSKVPFKGSNGFYDASADVEQVRRWFAETPAANLGLATGQPSKLFVVDLDLDAEKGKDGPRIWSKLEKEKGKVPETYTVLTPRGGRHLYFVTPDSHLIDSATDKLGDGIDIRGDGGYVVAPGSLVDGKPYRVINATPPAMPPQWLIEMVRNKPVDQLVEKTSSHEIQPLENRSSETRIGADGKDAPKIREALKFIAPTNYDVWLKVGMALHQWNRQAGLEIWNEWSKGDAEKYDPASIGAKWRSFDDGNGNGAVKIGTVFHMAQQAGWTPSTGTLPSIDNAASLLADETIVHPAELVEGVLHQGCKAVFGANSKARKTWLLLDLALSVQAGVPFWKWNTRKGRVLYINFEIPRAFIKSRIQKLCEAKGISDVSDLDVWTLRGHAAPLWKLLPEILSKIQSRHYALIIIDPIYKGLGGRDENSAGDTGQLCNELERLAVESGAAVVFAAHFSKGNQAGKEAMDRISGSGVFGRDPDSIITLTKHEQDGAYTVDLILRNFPEQQPFVVQWDFPLMTMAGELDPQHLKQAGRKQEHTEDDLFSVLPSTGLLSNEWQNAAEEEKGISRRTFFRLKKCLENGGRVLQSRIDSKWQPITHRVPK